MPTRRTLANAIRVLSMDAVQKANSGHPGMPMGMADIAEVLWNDFMQHSPNHPHWFNRDRFIISNGHGSMLLYALLHLMGYADMSLDEIKNFRQLHAKTAGHPEYGLAGGIETTTGPLGQGLANAVGMALAERTLAAQFNRPGFNIIDHFTYVFFGDGCLMEGISHEACSLAGHLGLGKLIGFWDDNGISIDGKVCGWFTDDTPKRFEAYNWHVIRNVDGHDAVAIRDAIVKARAVADKPSIICCKTTIAYGSPNLAGTSKAHGAALGEAEVTAVRKQLDWPYAPFEIPANIYAEWNAKARGDSNFASWQQYFADYAKAHPALAREFLRRIDSDLPENWQKHSNDYIQQTQNKAENIATRKASQNCLNSYGPLLPEFLGGSADLTESNLTNWSGSKIITNTEFPGNYLCYGVREFAMSAIMNGIALHQGFIPYGGTFLTFADYARNAVRLAAMMKQRIIFVYTHDSIGLGEDGPTHQPIEHAAMLRMTPGLSVWRPCDAVETAAAWKFAIEHAGPTCLLLTRQAVPHQTRNTTQVNNINRGGYILQDCEGIPEALIIATGSEVQLAIAAAQQLTQQGKKIRVVSMPSTDVFAAQDEAYKQTVIPDAITARVAVEAATTNFWYQYVGLKGKVIGIDRYGESAPAAEVYKALGVTVEKVVEAVNILL